MTDVERKCYQCGRPTEFILREDMTPDSWFTCDWCGENIVRVKDIMPNEEERAKRNLGFYDFKPTRGK